MDWYVLHHDIAMLVLRVVLGAIFVVHGHAKWKLLQQPQAPGGPANPMQALMKALAVCEPLGGLALIFGVLTTAAAVGCAMVMCGAIYMKATTWKTGFKSDKTTGWEFDLMNLAGLIAIILLGPGSYAIGPMLGL